MKHNYSEFSERSLNVGHSRNTFPENLVKFLSLALLVTQTAEI